MRVFSIAALADNYIHLAGGGGNFAGSAVVVDPGEAAPVLAFLTKHRLQVAAVLITHLHYDHIGGLGEVRRVFADAPVYAPAGMTNAKIVGGGDSVEVCGMSFRVLAVPGHTAEHIAFYGEGVLFCGDALFGGGCGRLSGGTAAQMHRSLQLLAGLPDDTKIYFGHEYTESNLRFARAVEPNNAALTERINKVQKLRAAKKPTVPSTIGEEKATNPFLRVHSGEVLQAAKKHLRRPPADDIEVFATLRSWKDNF
ncbi:MAG: hydroxyacylglutathione hydrolase [Gammaproteobacteria bacterium]